VRLAELLNRQKAAALAQDAGKSRGTVADLAVTAVQQLAEELSGPVPENDVYGRMRALSDSDREFGKPGDVMSRMYLRRCLEGRGWRDDCQSPLVRFVR
jgi:hypothetical protein